MDLDELLSARLVTFLMDNYQDILKVPLALQTSIEERVAHLRRVQVKEGIFSNVMKLSARLLESLRYED